MIPGPSTRPRITAYASSRTPTREVQPVSSVIACSDGSATSSRSTWPERLVAEPREGEAEPVAAPASLADLGDVAVRRQRPEHGEHGALGRVEAARELGEPQPERVGFGQRVEHVERPFDAADPVAFVRFRPA